MIIIYFIWNTIITFLNLYYIMNINFYVKSIGSFIILSVMWYERLTKCYLLHTDLSKFKELGKTCQVTYFPLSTLNHWIFTEHTSWPSKPRLPKFPRWDSWVWIMSQKWDDVVWAWTMGFGVILWIWTLLGFKIDFSKIHDNVDAVRVANEMKPCGVKNLSSTSVISVIFTWFLLSSYY